MSMMDFKKEISLFAHFETKCRYVICIGNLAILSIEHSELAINSKCYAFFVTA